MTSPVSYSLTHHDIETALRFLGPADLHDQAPQGCLDHLILMIKQLAVFLFRSFNLICGDHQWHNNLSARQIVMQYYGSQRTIQEDAENVHLAHRVEHLCAQLELRANGDVSYAEGINRCPLSSQQPQLTLIGDTPPLEGESQNHFAQLPHELLVEILKKLDGKSLANILVADSHLYNSMTSDRICFTPFLQEVTIQKMFNLALVIPNEEVGLLCSMAKSLAISHPEHARAAANHSLDCKDLALQEIACLQAAIDPDLALTTAQFIDNASRYKFIAISAIAKAYANTHPEQASHLFQQAIVQANSLTDRNEKTAALFAIAAALASSNPSQAMAVANQIRYEDTRRDVIDQIARTQALTDLERSLVIYEQIITTNGFNLRGSVHHRSLSEIALTQALINVDLAILTAQKITDSAFQSMVLAKIAITQARSNSEQAIASAIQLQDRAARFHALTGIAVAIASHDPDQAVHIAHLIEDQNCQSHALAEIAIALALINPDLAIATANRISKSNYVSQTVRTRAIEGIALALAIEDPDRVFSIITQGQSIGEWSYYIDSHLRKLVEKQAAAMPEQAIITANSIQSPTEKIHALCEIAKAQALTNLEIPLRLLQTIEEEEESSQVQVNSANYSWIVEKKLDIYCHLARQVAHTDPNQAYHFYQKSFSIAFSNSNPLSQFFSLERIINHMNMVASN